MQYFLWLVIALTGVELDTKWAKNLDEIDVYRVRVVAVAEDGTIAMIDRDQRHIVLLNDEGQLVHRITARGEGPGELQEPVEITYSPKDQSFAVLDFANARLSKWRKSGQFMAEYPMPRTFFRPEFSQADTVFLTREPFGRNGQKPALIALNLKSGSQSLVWEVTPEEPIIFSRIGKAKTAGEIVWRWNPALVYGIGQDFLAVAFGNERMVHLLDFDGKRQGKPIGAALPQYAVTKEQIEDGLNLMPANMHADLRAGLVKPSGWPPIRNVLVDGQDRIWVIGAAADVAKPHPYRVYGKDGKLLGSGKVEKLPLAANAHAIYYLKGEEDLYLVKAAIKTPS